METTEPRILLIETSAELCSVGLVGHGSEPEILESDTPFDHNKTLAPSISGLLDRTGIIPADLSAIAVSAGPGSYTGLRVGISTAKAMCYALGIPLIAIDTLYAFAHKAKESFGPNALYFPNVDARRMDVYMSRYDGNLVQLSENQAVTITVDAFPTIAEGGVTRVFCGSGTSKCVELLAEHDMVMEPMRCSARLLAGPATDRYRMKDFTDLISFRPEYVKAPNITRPAAHKA